MVCLSRQDISDGRHEECDSQSVAVSAAPLERSRVAGRISPAVMPANARIHSHRLVFMGSGFRNDGDESLQFRLQATYSNPGSESFLSLAGDAGQRADAVFVGGELGRRTVIDDAAVVEDIGAVGDGEAETHVLLDEQH
jgi:hypothetical protein